jgi:hypothetical protein
MADILSFVGDGSKPFLNAAPHPIGSLVVIDLTDAFRLRLVDARVTSSAFLLSRLRKSLSLDCSGPVLDELPGNMSPRTGRF